MLDDLAVIKQRDPQNALEFIAQQPTQLQYNFSLTQHNFDIEIKTIVFAGMGGSSLAAELARTYPIIKKPFVICKDYHLPAFIDATTLVICSSYSGNTEETLSCFQEAEQSGAQIAIIAHGGKLLEQAKAKNYPMAEVPECTQPRTSVFYMYRALLEILTAAEIVDDQTITELETVVEPLQQATHLWQASVPVEQNLAKQLATDFAGKTAIIYGGPLTYPVAYKWKIDFNENAKNTAWCNALPEFNHNEFLGWSSHPVEKPFTVIDLISSFENSRILKRFEVSDRMLSGMRPKATTIEAQGKSLLEQLLYLVLLGDYTTTYLALLNGVNPTPVDLVEKFKVELG